MKKSLMVVVAFVLIFTHIIPPLNISFANDEINECENMDFTVQPIKENDEKIVVTAGVPQEIEIEFKTKGKTEILNVDSSGKFELKVDEEFLVLNDAITISNDNFKIDTKVVPEGNSSSSLQSEQYVACPLVEETTEEPVLEEEEPKQEEATEDPVVEEEELKQEEAAEEPVLEEEEPKQEEATEDPVVEEEELKQEEAAEDPVVEEEEPKQEEAAEDPVVEEEKPKQEEAAEDPVVEEEEPKQEEAAEDPVVEEEELKQEEATEEPVTDSRENTSDFGRIKENFDIDKFIQQNPELYSLTPYKNIIRENNEISRMASLTEAQILTDITIDTELTESVDFNYYNLNLNLVGTGIVDAELVNPNRTVLFYAPDLAGMMYENSLATVNVEILPINLEEDLSSLNTAIGGLTGTVTDLITGLTTTLDAVINRTPLAGLVQVDGLQELDAALESLNNLDVAIKNLTEYNDQVAVNVNLDGTVVIEFSDGLGNHVETAIKNVVQSALTDVLIAVNGLDVRLLNNSLILGPLLNTLVINPLVNPLKSAVTRTVEELQRNLTNGVLGLTEELASVQVIGKTTVNTNVLVDRPTSLQGDVIIQGAGIQGSIIDLALLNSLESQDTIKFPDTTAPIISTVDITDNSTGGYTVSGTGEEPEDKVTISGGDGTELGKTTIAEDGTYSFDLAPGTVFPEEVLSLVGTDDAGNTGEAVTVTVPILKLVRVPNEIKFGNIVIKNEEAIFGRESTDNIIEIKDTRKDDDWILTAAAPDLSVDNNVLKNALIYKRNGEEVEISTEADTVAESTDANVVRGEDSDTITWNNNEGSEDGLLLKVNPIEAVAGEEYSTTIEWTLTDGP